MTDMQKSVLYRYIFLTIVLLIVYGNTLNHEFVWDDVDLIVYNPLLESLSNIPTFFVMEDRFETPTGYYRPMTYVSFALDRAMWGANPVGFNFTNLFLHILVTLIFYRVVVALFNRENLGFVSALLFSLHPIAVETVSFHAGGRNTLLSACFALLSLLFYIKRKHIPAVACFTVALFSKEFALLMPVIFFLYDYRLRPEKPTYSNYIHYLFPVIFYLMFRSLAVYKANFIKTLYFSEQLLLAPLFVVRYLINMVWPFQLKVYYSGRMDLYIAILCLACVILLISTIYVFRRNSELCVAVCWFLLFLLPVINIVPLPSSALIADRYAYFALMGFALALATFMCRWNLRIMVPGVFMLCTLYSLIDIKHNTIWKNDLTLFTQMTKDAPETYFGFGALGLYYYDNGDLNNAERYLTISCAKPDFPTSHLFFIASIFCEANRFDKAEALLVRAVESQPSDLEPYLFLEMICMKRGDLMRAQMWHDKANGIIPDIDKKRLQLSDSFSRSGEKYIHDRRYIRAANILRRALLVKPDYVPALVAMGHLGYEQGDFVSAKSNFEKVITLDPSNVSAHGFLHLVYQKRGRPAEVQR
jgi:protein O-mannosyl-transferase